MLTLLLLLAGALVPLVLSQCDFITCSACRAAGSNCQWCNSGQDLQCNLATEPCPSGLAPNNLLECGTFSCAHVYECGAKLGRGKCVGPDKCECSPGYILDTDPVTHTGCYIDPDYVAPPASSGALGVGEIGAAAVGGLVVLSGALVAGFVAWKKTEPSRKAKAKAKAKARASPDAKASSDGKSKGGGSGRQANHAAGPSHGSAVGRPGGENLSGMYANGQMGVMGGGTFGGGGGGTGRGSYTTYGEAAGGYGEATGTGYGEAAYGEMSGYAQNAAEGGHYSEIASPYGGYATGAAESGYGGAYGGNGGGAVAQQQQGGAYAENYSGGGHGAGAGGYQASW